MIGYDTVSNSFWVPDDAEFAVCYGDGIYENEKACHGRFPELVKAGRIIDLTVRSALWKDPFSGSDIEPGNAGPKTAVGYVKGEHSLGVARPDVYADQSDMREILAQFDRAGIHIGAPGPTRPWKMYVSHPNGHEHLCGPSTCGFPVAADITQFWWSDIFGKGNWRNFPGDLDVNIARDDAFGPPKPVSPYLIFDNHTYFKFHVNHGDVHWTERDLIERVDGALQHTPKYHDYLKGQLRAPLKQVRDRIWKYAKFQPPQFTHPRPHVDWGTNKRGTRWQLVNHRIQKIDALR